MIIKSILNLIKEIILSIWYATITIVWGIVSIFLFSLILSNTNTEISAVASLLNISIFVMKYWIVFWSIMVIERFVKNTRRIKK